MFKEKQRNKHREDRENQKKRDQRFQEAEMN